MAMPCTIRGCDGNTIHKRFQMNAWYRSKNGTPFEVAHNQQHDVKGQLEIWIKSYCNDFIVISDREYFAYYHGDVYHYKKCLTPT